MKSIISKEGELDGFNTYTIISTFLPWGGRCSVEPLEGTALQTVFKLSCFDWMDEGGLDASEEPVLSYRFFANNDSVSYGQESVATNLILPAGPDANDHMMEYRIEICDAYLACAEYSGHIKVKPLVSIAVPIDDESDDTVSEAELQEKAVDKLAGSLDTLASLEDLGNPKNVRTMIMSLSNTLTTATPAPPALEDIPAEEAIGGRLMEQESVVTVKAKQMKSAMVDAAVSSCSGNNAPIDGNALLQCGSAIGAVTANPDQLTEEAQEAALNAATELAGGLEAMANEGEVDTSQVKKVGTAILGIVASNVPMEEKSGALSTSCEDIQDATERTVCQKQIPQAALKKEKAKKQQKERSDALNKNVASIGNALSKTLAVGKTSTIGTPTLLVNVARTSGNDLAATEFPSGNDGSSIALSGGLVSNEPVNIQLTNTKGNIAAFAEGADSVTSGINTLSLFNEEGAVKPDGVVIQQSFNVADFVKRPGQKIKGRRGKMAYIKTETCEKQDMQISMSDGKDNQVFKIAVKCGEYPKNPKDSNCDVITFKPAESDVIIVPYECVVDCVCDGDIIIGALIRTKKGGRGKRQADNSNTTVEDDNYSDYIDWNTVSDAELEDMGIDPDDAGDMPDTDVASVGCKVFNGTDWVSDGCRISPLSTANNTKCDCDLAETPAFTFATSFMVMPNTIDFNAVFANYDFGRNAAVFATLLALLAIYIPIVIWARRNDNKDILRWGVTLLKDNDPDEHYFYIINVYTGMRRGAGTKSKISFILAGQDEDTGVRQLDDGLRTEFGRGNVLRFLCSTPESLGQLKYIRMWHDNSGGGENSSWYLARVLVQDIQTDDTFVFVCGKWLGVEMGDGEIERLIPAAESDTLRTFNHLFDDNARKRVTEDHLWFSILMRPQRSNFTRVQRVSCCLSLLFLTMIANCMFFGQENAVENPMVISVGPLSFGIHTIWISFISILVVMPVSLVCVELFKRARPRKTQIGTGVNPTDSGDEKPIGCCNKLLHNVPIRGRVYMPIDQEEKTLPYWVAYIGWTLVVLSVVASGFFILLYTQQWGEEKSSQWLSTFMLSFFQSLLVMDPVKVAVIAAALSIIFRKPRLIGDTIEMNTLKEDEEYIQQNTSERNAAARAKYYKPMSKRKIREFRKERHREIALQGLTREIVLYIIFMWIIYSISQSNRDDMSYRITEVLSKSILDDLTTSLKPEGFYESNTRKKFMEWMDEELLPVMFADVNYKGDKLTWKDQLYMEDLANFRVGPMRLRQLRQKEDLSDPDPGWNPFNTLEPNVVVNTTDGTTTRAKYGWYEFGNEEDRDFCLGWKSQPCPPAEAPYSWSSPAWNYTSAFDVWGIPILGLVDTYSGGGYIATLDTTYPIARLTLNEMWKNFWIDRQTRVVFIEFTVYNANINIFTVVTLMAEFPASGGIIPYATLHSFRLYMHEGAQGLYNLACEIIFIIFLGYLIYQQFNVCRRVGRKGYFSAGWHVFDFLTIIGSLIAIVMYFIRYAMTRETMNKFAEDPKAFVDFNHIAQWDQILGWTVAFLVFFFTCKFLRILRFNKRMGWLSAVLSAASKDLANFSFIFFVMLFGFTTFAYVVFGQHVKGFSTMGRSVGSLLAHILGDIQYEDIVTVNVGLAQFFFLFFTGLFTMVLIHMFICIVNIAIYTVKKNTKMVPNEYEVIDYILESFGEWANIKWLMPKRSKKKRDGYDPDSVEALKERRTKVLCELMVQQWVDILHKVDFETKQYVMKVDELANRTPKDATSPTTSADDKGSKQEDNNRGKENNDVKKDDNISLISESVSREGTGLAEVET